MRYGSTSWKIGRSEKSKNIIDLQIKLIEKTKIDAEKHLQKILDQFLNKKI